MAWQIATSTTGPGVAQALAINEDLYVGSSVLLELTGDIGISAVGPDHQVIVDGTVRGSAGGIAFGVGNCQCPIVGEQVTIGQSGVVMATKSGAALSIQGSESVVTNHGLLGGAQTGLVLAGTTGVESSLIVNTGTIDAAASGVVHQGTETLRLNNSGLINGVLLSYDADTTVAASDVVSNTGTMNGSVSLGAGDDVLNTARGRIRGTIDAGSGADGVAGSAYADKIFGGSGDDTISGLAGKDLITGGAGRGFLLRGGLGADQFIFADKGDSTGGLLGRDDILDFNHAEHDRMHLSAIDADGRRGGNQAFHFIGTDAFTGHAGELRYVHAGSNTYVYADTDGNRVVDFAIHLKNVPVLVAADFYL